MARHWGPEEVVIDEAQDSPSVPSVLFEDEVLKARTQCWGFCNGWRSWTSAN